MTAGLTGTLIVGLVVAVGLLGYVLWAVTRSPDGGQHETAAYLRQAGVHVLPGQREAPGYGAIPGQRDAPEYGGAPKQTTV